MSVGARTIDGAPMLRCMAVALNDAQLKACRHAIAPVEVVTTGSVGDACTSMSTVLPLIVIVDEEISEADRQAITEFATACSAELVSVEAAPNGKVFIARILEALRVAERRRSAAAR